MLPPRFNSFLHSEQENRTLEGSLRLFIAWGFALVFACLVRFAALAGSARRGGVGGRGGGVCAVN